MKGFNRYKVVHKEYERTTKRVFSYIAIARSKEDLLNFLSPAYRSKVKSIEEIEPEKTYRI
ncbi:MAG: hypothetical protein HRT59_26730 [Crocosphaera sp.]|nr:hypothetical protein [Crocosphaera sp.]